MPVKQKKLLNLIRELNDIMVAHWNLPVVYSCDEEWNSFSPLYFTPTVGEYKGDDRYWEFETETKTPNCICIN